MSTRSFIGALNGTIEAIYCHHDGYPDGVGATLHSSYMTGPKVRALLKLGDMSQLGKTVKSSVFYVRDRGEESQPTKTYETDAEFTAAAMKHGCEYAYLFTGSDWLIYEF